MIAHSAIRRAILFIGMAVALMLGVLPQASAGTINITYTGSVTNGSDDLGVFGTAGASLTGASYSLVFTVNPDAGSYSTYSGLITDPAIVGDYVLGGMAAAITINGINYAFTGVGTPTSNFDLLGTKAGFGGLSQQFSASDSSFFNQVLMSLSVTNPPAGFPTSVYTEFALAGCPDGSSCSSSGLLQIEAGGHSTFAALGFGSVTVSTTPIPATLPLMVSALGGLGFAGWRRKRQCAAA